MCGTPGYLAPEMLKQESYSLKYDVFCLGLILYELLTGKALFYTGNNSNDMLRL